jgi:hypothetical protein
MATIGGVFGSLAAFISRFRPSAQPVPADAGIFDEAARRFLFAQTWLVNPGDHNIKEAMYLGDKEMLALKFKSGEIATYENVTIAEALAYFQAPSKGKFQWNFLLVRGKGNKGKSQKPWHYGLG